MDLVTKKFKDIFRKDGTDIVALVNIVVSGIYLAKGTILDNGVVFSVNFLKYKDNDIAVEEAKNDKEEDMLVIKGFYV